ncbi:MAG: PBP1A family penicillin-binding protein [Candidatus Parcubacteria bacterium]|nr:PBP1A family penicillin-binding protein [Candidatus Parcubacteria bacterium]
MPIPQLTQSPKNWEKYKKQLKRDGFLKTNFLALFSLFIRLWKNKKQGLGKKIVVTLFSVGVVCVLLGGIVFMAALAWYSHDLPDPNKVIDRVIAQSTKIYDRKGETLLYEIHGNEKRTVIELDQISPYIVKATIAAEDRHFYEHHGINFFSIIEGVVIDPLLGRGFRGGSTITQQLVKKAILTDERSISRKMKEWVLSYQIEKKFSKDQILKMYFNEIPYGSVNYGVESAANYFFGKHAKDVTLAEAAILSALPQAPTRLSPYGSNIDQLYARQRWILDSMVETGAITKEEAETAKAEKVEFQKESLSGITAPHFVFYVKELLAEKLGEKALEQGGIKVITTLDLDKQKIAEEAVTNANEKNLTYKATNAAMVSVDAKTGEILAMVGSQDFTNEEIDGQVNVTIQPRQPGSSIKPIVYAAAFEKGFTTETVLYDVNTTFPSSPKPYEPRDYDKKERGPITMRRALAGSLNIPAVKTLYLAGYENVKKIMQDLGYSTITDKSQCGLALVLGGCEVKLIDHVGAFTAFARDGERAELAAILKIEDKDGKVLDEFKEIKHKVWSENTARQINSILTDDAARAYIFGAGSPLTLKDRPLAGKTGTTNDNNDAWTIGYTPSYVTGVWVGNSNGDDMTGRADGVNVAAPIMNEYMRRTLADTPVEYFKAPEELSPDLKPILRGVIPADMEVEIDKASGKLATPYTPSSYRIKKKFNQHHDIIYYVNKDDPRGSAPENPQADPMFIPWEEGVKAWAEKIAKEQNIELSSETVPTEYDDLHVPENFPTISILSPQNNQTLESYPIKFNVMANAPRGLSKVIYEIDGQIVGMSATYPFGLDLNGIDAVNGYHKLKATAYDDIDNSASVEIEVNLKLPYAAPQITWLSGRDNVTYYKSSFPLNINFNLTKITGIKKLTLYYSQFGSSQTTKLADIYDLKAEEMTVVWQGVQTSGTYEIFGEFEEESGAKSQSNKLIINILD